MKEIFSHIRKDDHATYTVLGASGFVGSRILQMLKSEGKECYAPAKGDAEIFERDLGRVFYCIGLTADYAQRPFDTVEAHVGYLARILEKAKFDRLVYLSSTRLYDSLQVGGGMEDANLVFNPVNPRHIYDLSKALGESLCMTASGGRACVARLSCVFDDTPGSPGFLSELINRLRIERSFVLASSSGYARDYISLNDVVLMLRIILDSGQHEIFNVASGENVTNQEIVDELNSNGCQISLRDQSNRQSSVVCSIERVREMGVIPVLVRDYLRLFLNKLDADATR